MIQFHELTQEYAELRGRLTRLRNAGLCISE